LLLGLVASIFVERKLGDSGMKKLADAMKSNKTAMTSLDLRGMYVLRVCALMNAVSSADNNIGNEGMLALAEAMMTQSSLTNLRIGGKHMFVYILDISERNTENNFDSSSLALLIATNKLKKLCLYGVCGCVHTLLMWSFP
jgi:hypothetical protein